MGELNALLERLLDHLRQDRALGHIRFVRYFSRERGQNPVRIPWAAVGFSKIRVRAAGISLAPRELEITLKIRLSAGLDREGTDCQILFEQICESLLFCQQDFSLSELTCGESIYDAKTDSFYADAYLQTVMGLCGSGEEEEQEYQAIRLISREVKEKKEEQR